MLTGETKGDDEKRREPDSDRGEHVFLAGKLMKWTEKTSWNLRGGGSEAGEFSLLGGYWTSPSTVIHVTVL